MNQSVVVAFYAPDVVRPICSGVVVAETLVATSARCVLELEEFRRRGVFVDMMVAHESRPMGRLWRHPDFDAESLRGADVGLVEARRPFAYRAHLAEEPLPEGAAAGAMGYGERGLVAAPLRIEEYDGDAFVHTRWVPAGGPVFGGDGRLVAIHATAPGAGASPGTGQSAREVAALMRGISEAPAGP